MNWLIHYHTSTVQPVKFRYGQVISPHMLCGCNYFSMQVLNLIHISKMRPLRKHEPFVWFLEYTVCFILVRMKPNAAAMELRLIKGYHADVNGSLSLSSKDWFALLFTSSHKWNACTTLGPNYKQKRIIVLNLKEDAWITKHILSLSKHEYIS